MIRNVWRKGKYRRRYSPSITQLLLPVLRFKLGFPPLCPLLILTTFALVVCFNQPVVAQTSSPDPEYQRQQERERALRRQQEPPTDARMPAAQKEGSEAVIPEHETPCFPIAQIVLDGQQADQFKEVLSVVTQGPEAVLGRCLGVSGIKAVLARVQNILIARGYVTTRVLAAPQNLSSGVLQLTLVPGHVRVIRLAPGADARATLWNALP